MFTDNEKRTAKAIVENKEISDLLAKILLVEEDRLSAELIATKTNEELGEFVRANALAETKVKLRFNQLKLLAQDLEPKAPRVVPK
jgi:hypothetical protein